MATMTMTAGQRRQRVDVWYDESATIVDDDRGPVARGEWRMGDEGRLALPATESVGMVSLMAKMQRSGRLT